MSVWSGCLYGAFEGESGAAQLPHTSTILYIFFAPTRVQFLVRWKIGTNFFFGDANTHELNIMI